MCSAKWPNLWLENMSICCYHCSLHWVRISFCCVNGGESENTLNARDGMSIMIAAAAAISNKIIQFHSWCSHACSRVKSIFDCSSLFFQLKINNSHEARDVVGSARRWTSSMFDTRSINDNNWYQTTVRPKTEHGGLVFPTSGRPMCYRSVISRAGLPVGLSRLYMRAVHLLIFSPTDILSVRCVDNDGGAFQILFSNLDSCNESASAFITIIHVYSTRPTCAISVWVCGRFN